jgi:hypothetical protein
MKQYIDTIKRVLTADENIILAQLPRPLDTIYTIDDQHLMDEAMGNAYNPTFTPDVKLLNDKAYEYRTT